MASVQQRLELRQGAVQRLGLVEDDGKAMSDDGQAKAPGDG
jgi:hypothetical protein